MALFVRTHRLYNTQNEPQDNLWTLGDNGMLLRIRQLLQMPSLFYRGRLCISGSKNMCVFPSSKFYCDSKAAYIYISI